MKTDNSFLSQKVDIRSDVVRMVSSPRVLDCYSGNGDMWTRVNSRLTITRIEKEPNKCKYPHLLGPNEKFLRSLNLSDYDIIDLDSYGIPFEQLEILFKKKYSGYVILTFCQIGIRQLPKKMCNILGYTDSMYSACKTLICRDGMKKMKAYLHLRGVSEIIGYFNLGNPGTRNYFWFKM